MTIDNVVLGSAANDSLTGTKGRDLFKDAQRQASGLDCMSSTKVLASGVPARGGAFSVRKRQKTT